MTGTVNKAKNGFTLIEILVVVAIIGLLSSIIFVSITSARQKARDAIRFADIKRLDTAIKQYILDHGEAPLFSNGSIYGTIYDFDGPGWLALNSQLAPYLSNMPKDPCGIKCYDDVAKKWYVYEYVEPKWMIDLCGGDPSCVKIGKESYQVYAEELETRPGYMGFTSFGSLPKQ